MPNLILLIVCFLLGRDSAPSRAPARGTPAALNAFIIHVSLPALTLLYVHELPMERSLAYPARWHGSCSGSASSSSWLSGGRWLAARTVGGLILVGSLANTSFLGLPMIETFYGEEHLGLGILIDQLGTYMVLSTLGILIAVVYASGDASPAAIARKILRFPPFQAVVLALALKPSTTPPGAETCSASLARRSHRSLWSRSATSCAWPSSAASSPRSRPASPSSW